MPPTSKPTNINKEISILRSLISRTRRQINDGTADPVQGGRLIAQTSIALSKLVLVQHHITPDPLSVLDQETAELKAEIERIFRELGWSNPRTGYSPPPEHIDPPNTLKLVPMPPNQSPPPNKKHK